MWSESPPPFFPFFFKLKKKENPRNPTGTRDGFFSFLDLIIQEIIKRKKKRGMAVTILQQRLRGGGAGDGVARCGAASGARVIAAWSRVSGRGAGVRLCVSTAPGLRLPPCCPAPRVGGPAAPRFPVAPAAVAPQPRGWPPPAAAVRSQLLRFPPSAVSNAAFRGHIRRVCGTLHPQTPQTTPSPRLKIYVKGFSPAELEPALPRCPEGPGCVLDLST